MEEGLLSNVGPPGLKYEAFPEQWRDQSVGGHVPITVSNAPDPLVSQVYTASSLQ